MSGSDSFTTRAQRLRDARHGTTIDAADKCTCDCGNTHYVRKGGPSRLAIAINLRELEGLMREYVDEEWHGDKFLMEQMLLGHFLLWLTKRQETNQLTKETTNEQETRHT